MASKLERDLEQARAELAGLMDAAVNTDNADLKTVAVQVVDLRSRIEEMEQALDRSRRVEQEREQTLAAIQAERQRRDDLAALAKEVEQAQERWERWQDKYLEMNANAVALFADLDAVRALERQLWTRARRLDVDAWSLTERPDVRAVRSSRPAVPWPQ